MKSIPSETDRLATALARSLDGLCVLQAVRDDAGAIVDFRVVASNPGAERFGCRGPGSTLAGTWAAPVCDELVSVCAAVVRGTDAVTHELQLPAVGWVELRLAGMDDDEVVATLRGSGERHAIEAALRREREQSLALADEQAALRRAAEAIAHDRGPEEVIALVTRDAARLFRAHSARVARFAPDAIVVVGTWGGDTPAVGTRFPRDGGRAIARVLATGRSARVADYGALRSADPISASVVPAAYGSGMAAPIRAGATLWGGLLLVRLADDEAFTEADELRLEGFAELIGLAVTNSEAEHRLRALAATDPLTGLANHRQFQERLSAEVARASRYGHPLSLVLLDLDRFKRVNDRHGHQTGDSVLAEVARRMAQIARGGDLAARVGGEEFAWLLPETDAVGALTLAERMRAAVETEPFDVAGQLTASLGVAALGAAGDGGDLFRRADGALRWAKLAGRNRSECDRPEMPAILARGGDGLHDEHDPEHVAAIRALAMIVNSDSPHFVRHADRVAEVAEALARELGWDHARTAALSEAALLHGVGCIGIPVERAPAPGRARAVGVGRRARPRRARRPHRLARAGPGSGVLGARPPRALGRGGVPRRARRPRHPRGRPHPVRRRRLGGDHLGPATPARARPRRGAGRDGGQHRHPVLAARGRGPPAHPAALNGSARPGAARGSPPDPPARRPRRRASP